MLFDLLALGDDDLTGLPFSERRARLEGIVARRRSGVGDRPDRPTSTWPQRWFSQFEGAGLDGIVAKDPAGLYEPGKRTMQKIKHERTADCVVAGYRPHASGAGRAGVAAAGAVHVRGRAGVRRGRGVVPDGASA